jgi:hypothetical protein
MRKLKGTSSPCMHHEHNPPMFYVYQNGTYEWTCPGCGHRQYLTVHGEQSCVCGQRTWSGPGSLDVNPHWGAW